VRIRLLFLLVATLTLAGAACGSDDGGQSASSGEVPEIPENAVDLTGQVQVDITIGDNNFEPQVVLVSPETEITWTNTGRNSHNVISSADEPAFEQIDTEVLGVGGSGSRSFDTVGAFPYYCSIHGSPNRGQRGSIVVMPAAP